MEILLTNDDGIDAPGLRAAYESLSEVGDVTVVAPSSNQSAVGRSLSYGRTADNEGDFEFSSLSEFSFPVPHDDHELGYAVDGTPCDAVILGINALETRPDIVVSGCNPGANLGAAVLSRSGTASAAMEAAFLGVPAMAVSMDTLGYDPELEPADFRETTDLAAQLVDYALEAEVFDEIDYLNVNGPGPHRTLDGIQLTRPTPVYEMDAVRSNGQFHLRNRLWEQMAEGDLPDPDGTDRRAVIAGRFSISPLGVPVEPRSHGALDAFAERVR